MSGHACVQHTNSSVPSPSPHPPTSDSKPKEDIQVLLAVAYSQGLPRWASHCNHMILDVLWDSKLQK